LKPKAWIPALGLLLAGCGTREELSPVSSFTAGTTDGGVVFDAGLPPPADAGVVKRRVMTRSPLGGPAGNLFADGDFELSTLPWSGAQVGWRGFDSSGGSTLVVRTETGGLCYSGLRCAIFEPKTIFFLRGTAANGKGNVASIRARVPADAKCNAVKASLLTCDSGVLGKSLAPSAEPDADGWCRYGAVIGEQTSAQCLYLTNNLKNEQFALVDAAVLAPDDGTVLPQSAVPAPLSAEETAALARVIDLIHRTTDLGPGPRVAPRPLP
jgi:hypothetical protein